MGVDLVSAGIGVAVTLGLGNGTFRPTVHYATAGNPVVLTLADLDGDKHLDVIATNPRSRHSHPASSSITTHPSCATCAASRAG